MQKLIYLCTILGMAYTIDYYKQMPLDPIYMTDTITFTSGNMALCSTMCSQRTSCGAFKYNLSGTNDCTLSNFQPAGSCSFNFNTGRVDYYVRLTYSADFCFVKLATSYRTNMPQWVQGAFCNFLGGKLPEIKSATDVLRLQPLVPSYLGLALNTNQLIWHWRSDNSVVTEFNITNTDSTKNCARFALGNAPSYTNPILCNYCMQPVCQLC